MRGMRGMLLMNRELSGAPALEVFAFGGACLFVLLALVPFLELLVVYLRCPCAGRHLLFFACRKEK
ncbi:hypothetical protein SAMN05446635_3659 [Burkholderia sp. OK233]|nr:hypothetical protein SAMN05446635_3659 [Burkholderia sp. OK233]